MEATIDSVGRVVVPKPLRDALGLPRVNRRHLPLRGRTPTRPDRPHRPTGRRIRGARRPRRHSYRRRRHFRASRRRSTLKPLALDTSVAVPLLVQNHAAHSAVTRWWNHREVALCGHASVETYAVLTRLPGDARLAPLDAAHLLRQRFGPPLLLGSDVSGRIADVLSEIGVAGGAVYDALVALAAVEHDADLATRDQRARDTYEAIGARVVIAG